MLKKPLHVFAGLAVLALTLYFSLSISLTHLIQFKNHFVIYIKIFPFLNIYFLFVDLFATCNIAVYSVLVAFLLRRFFSFVYLCFFYFFLSICVNHAFIFPVFVPFKGQTKKTNQQSIETYIKIFMLAFITFWVSGVGSYVQKTHSFSWVVEISGVPCSHLFSFSYLFSISMCFILSGSRTVFSSSFNAKFKISMKFSIRFHCVDYH